VGTLALRVADARKTDHRGHPEAVIFHAVDLAIETGEICDHKRVGVDFPGVSSTRSHGVGGAVARALA
jgi:hypothetical protein